MMHNDLPKVILQLRVRKVDPWPPMIWQGRFQGFIKQIIKMFYGQSLPFQTIGPFRGFRPMQIALGGFRPAFAEAATRRQV
jgi:hypothetical protein